MFDKKIIFKLIVSMLLLLCAVAVFASTAVEKPFLHPLFSDNMVIQRDVLAPVWGWTTPGAAVTVSMCGKKATATADANGKWMVKIGPFKAGGPYSLVVTGSQRKVALNVLAGDVWICSGQSNMQFGMPLTNNADSEIAAANYPQIRLINILNKSSLTPRETTDISWSVCSPEAVRALNFTAVGYFFGRQLNRDLNVPIGLIEAAWGGTPAEAWVSAEALSTMEDFRSRVAMVTDFVAHPDPSLADKAMTTWWNENDAVSINKLGWENPGFDVSSWQAIEQPKHWDTADLKDYDGIVWMNREINIPFDPAGKPAVIQLGAIDDGDMAMINGVKVGCTFNHLTQRNYSIPDGVLKQGKNTIIVRVVDTGGGGGITADPNQFCVKIGESSISLVGQWKYKISGGMKTNPPYSIDSNPNEVTVLYNGMIAPLVPFAIKGAIWYQGESNSSRAMQYRTLLPTMINDWRARFGVGKFPFYIVQLANFTAPVPDPVQSGWAELREAQLFTAENLENCGLAVTIDIGETWDIHPKNKQDAGYRLALAAEAKTYGKKIEYSGPIYSKMKIEGSAIRLYFDHLGGGLVAKDSDKLKGFAIAGADKKWVWADAVIDGNTIVVSAASIAKPAAVRYNWANNPSGNLYNKTGLPASPFRTDPD